MAEEEDIPSYSYDPDKAWSIISVKQTVKTVKPLAHSSPKPPGHTRFVCISGEPGAHTDTRTDTRKTHRERAESYIIQRAWCRHTQSH